MSTQKTFPECEMSAHTTDFTSPAFAIKVVTTDVPLVGKGVMDRH